MLELMWHVILRTFLPYSCHIANRQRNFEIFAETAIAIQGELEQVLINLVEIAFNSSEFPTVAIKHFH